MAEAVNAKVFKLLQYTELSSIINLGAVGYVVTADGL
jgi:hypothetical protein